MKYIFLVVFVFVVSSCGTLHQTIPDGYAGNTATIVDSYSNFIQNKADYFVLTKVDGKLIEDSWRKTRSNHYGRGSVFTPSIVSREVLPVKQRFTLEGLVYYPTDGQALFGDSMKIEKNIVFTPVAGETYFVKGALSSGGSMVWLEDSKGNMVFDGQ
ncbi:hypothetical protein [Teredinibacter purpureus]|uniref:hypothetical protein n=1 Tax=Teredinibacter purpureus TaxID=2731756 RepID=UPI0005F7FF68|nr:hypothetical protein [Teredinibacter purpureus]